MRHTLNDWEIASRLSYFLWSTMPDDELFALAEAGQAAGQGRAGEAGRADARRPARAAVHAIRSPRSGCNCARSACFRRTRNCIPITTSHLEASMIGETSAFFREVLDGGLTLREFLDSDWTMVNARLAQLLRPARGRTAERRIPARRAASPSDHRGGLLTQAAILSLTSDGTRHRPVHRGKWVIGIDLRQDAAAAAGERRADRAESRRRAEGDAADEAGGAHPRRNVAPPATRRSIRSASRSTTTTPSAAGGRRKWWKAPAKNWWRARFTRCHRDATKFSFHSTARRCQKSFLKVISSVTGAAHSPVRSRILTA